MKTTGQTLVDHWTWAAKKGLMNRNSALSLRSACSKVMGVLEGWEEMDVTSLDPDDVIHRFQNLHARDFTPSSLDAYGKRFRNALESFIDYTRDPSAWKPSSKPSTQKSPDAKHGGKSLPKRARSMETGSTPEVPSPASGGGGHGLIEYPFPLRDGSTARLILPRDMTVAEARRIHAFMKTLAVDYEPSES